ncbi:MAG: V-type ATPase subunit [Candidatus Uhrbacteria bacterium]
MSVIRENYIYATAKVRSLEQYLLSDSDMTRVIDAKTPDIAFKAFNSLDYAAELLDLEAEDYRTAMDRKMTRLKKVLRHIVPDQDLLRLLFIERDYYNIKFLLKKKATGQIEFDLSNLSDGLCKVDQLKRHIIDELESDIDIELRGDISDLRSAIGESADAETIANLVNQKMNKRNHQLTEKINNQFITKLYHYLADKNNINLFLRARSLGKNKNWFESRVNDTGSIPAQVYLDVYDVGEDETFLNQLRIFLPSKINERIEEYQKDKGIWHIELGVNNVIIDHLREAKIIGFGPEVIVAYFFAKKYAIKNLSTIMALKFGQIEPAEIREHLVESY